MRFKKIVLPLLAAALLGSQAQAQSVSYTPLFDNSTFSRSIDLSKPVGTIDGAAGTTPSGGATYTIPIKMPPGTNGMTPQLSIVYNSQGGNSILGQGWSLSGLSAITRAGKDFYHDGKAGPVTYTNEDAFVLDGQRLFPMTGSNGAPGTTYRTEAESYSVATSYETIGGGPRYFNVVSKDGTIMQYGYTTDARFMSNDDSKIMMWRLNKIQDINGNYIWFTYDNTDGESRLSKVVYTGNLSAGLTPYNEINFHYVDRPDKVYVFSGENQYYAASLLQQIEIKEIGGSIFKKYEFSYGTDMINSYLKSVEEIAATGSRLNDTRFLYGERPSPAIEIAETNLVIGEKDRISSGDFNGDGIVDILKVSKGSSGYTDMSAYFAPYASATYTLGKSMTGMSDVETYGSASVYDRTGYVASDYDGDGRDEVLALSSYGVFGGSAYDKCRLHTPDKASSIVLTKEIPAPPSPRNVPGTGRRFLAGDFDGDKRTDYLLIVWEWTDLSKTPWKGRCKAYINFPAKGIYNSPIELSHSTDMDFDWPNRFNSWRDVHVMDYDGDGISSVSHLDFVVIGKFLL